VFINRSGEEGMMRFTERVVVVTGAAQGIGGAVARAFTAEGARVAALDIDENGLAALAGGTAGRGAGMLTLRTDVTASADVCAAVDAVVARWGRVDILVNNAGGFGTVRAAAEDIPDDEWDFILRLNLTSAFLCAKAVLPGMKQRRWGRIVNLSSIGGRGGAVLLSASYAAAKAAILGFTRHLALETARSGVTVNAVAPGTTATERFRALRTPADTEALVQRVPMGRVAEPSEIARCVLFLASDDAAYMTGACLDVNGGVLMV
jgi:NAD(P)-dependent dehydrogenase (short-subunit alcohol dehydrogenase family)